MSQTLLPQAGRGSLLERELLHDPRAVRSAPSIASAPTKRSCSPTTYGSVTAGGIRSSSFPVRPRGMSLPKVSTTTKWLLLPASGSTGEVRDPRAGPAGASSTTQSAPSTTARNRASVLDKLSARRNHRATSPGELDFSYPASPTAMRVRARRCDSAVLAGAAHLDGTLGCRPAAAVLVTPCMARAYVKLTQQ